MQWNSTVNAGFTTGKPWLVVNPNYTAINVEASEKDKNSILNFVRQLIKLRNDNKDILVYGKYTLLDKSNPDVYAYNRESGGKKFLVLLNFHGTKATLNTGFDFSKAKLLISNYETPAAYGSLRPYEAVIFEL